MVQVLAAPPPKGPSFLQSLLGGLASGVQPALEKYEGLQREAKQNQAMKSKFGEEIANLPPEVQKIYAHEAFKNEFAPKGPKPLTELQQTQKTLNEEKIKALQGQQELFGQLTSGNQESPSIGQEEGIPGQEAPQSNKGWSTVPDDLLHQTAMFAGQPGLPGTLGTGAKNEIERREKEKNLSEKRKIANRKEEIEFHKESQKYDDDLLKQAKIAKNQNETFKSIENAIASGNVKPTSMANILKNFGPIGELVSTAVTNKDEATLQASIPALLEGWKDVFGVRLTDADLKILQDKLPSIGKTPEANRAIINIMKKYSDMTLLRNQIATDIKEKNKGLRPLGYATMIETRFDEMTTPVKIINPKNGREIEIPAYKLSDALKSGAKLATPQEEMPNEQL